MTRLRTIAAATLALSSIGIAVQGVSAHAASSATVSGTANLPVSQSGHALAGRSFGLPATSAVNVGKGGHGRATIISVSGNLLTVQYGNGTKQQVQVGTGTQIITMVTGSVSDLKAGETIDVRGGMPSTTTASSTISATQIVIHLVG